MNTIKLAVLGILPAFMTGLGIGIGLAIGQKIVQMWLK